MAPTLYYVPASAPVRAVLMTGKALGVKFILKEVDLASGELKTPDFLKINPQHSVPTLVDDDGFSIWDSHAIMPYLISKYGKDDSLYPTDFKKRALIDQRLHFDSGVVFEKIAKIVRPIVFHGKKSIDKTDIEGVHSVYQLLEEFLDGRQWIAGDSVTIADFSLISSITSSHLLIPISADTYPRVAAWIKKAEALPVYDQNKIGLEMLDAMFKSRLSGVN